MEEILQYIRDLLPRFCSMGYERFDDISDSESDKEDDKNKHLYVESRQRRAGFSALHFQKEKTLKLIASALHQRDTVELSSALQGIDLSELTTCEKQEEYHFLKYTCNLLATDLTAVLLRFHADVNSFDGGSCLPLHTAARKGHLPMCALLLSKGAKVNLLTKYEFKSALHLATLRGHRDIVQLLLQNRADVNIKDIYQETPLHLACRLGRTDVVQLLINNNASIDAYDIEGWTGLHLAAESGNLDTVKVLLDNNASVDCQTNYGRTALSWACASGHVHVVSLLLERGADANIRDKHNKQAFQYTRELKLKSLVLSHTEKAEDKKVSTIGLYIEIDPRRDKIFLKQKSKLITILDTWTTIGVSESVDTAEIEIPKAWKHNIKRQSNSTLLEVTKDPPNKTTSIDNTYSSELKHLSDTTNSQLDQIKSNIEAIARDLSEEQMLEKTHIPVLASVVEQIDGLRISVRNSVKKLIQEQSDYTKVDTVKSGLGFLGYIALLQIFQKVVVNYIASRPNGWMEFLTHIPNLPNEIQNVMAIKLQSTDSIKAESTKIEYILSYWAKNEESLNLIYSNEQTVPYMKRIVDVIDNCMFNNGEEKGDSMEVMKEMMKQAQDLRGGLTSNCENNIAILQTKLSSKQKCTLLNVMTSKSTESNVFPELEGILDNFSRTEPEVSTTNVEDKLKGLLREVLETEDTNTLPVVMRTLVNEECEHLLCYVI